MSYAKVTLEGFLAGSPELKYAPSGAPVARFSIPVSKKNKDGEKGETTWYQVMVWGSSAEKVVETLDKGSKVKVEGALKVRTYESNGQTKVSVDVTARSIIEDTGADIDIQDDGTVFVSSKDHPGGERAKKMIEQLTKEVGVGEKYIGHVTRLMPFGAFVEILPGKEGLVHISRLAPQRVEKVEDVVKVGDEVEVEVIEIDRQGRTNLTIAGVEARPGSERRERERPRERRAGGGRGHR